MIKRGTLVAVAAALSVAPAADAAKPGAGPVEKAFTAPYSYANGYGGCADADPATGCTWSATGTTAGLFTIRSGWEPFANAPAGVPDTGDGNSYAGAYVNEYFSVPRGTRTIEYIARYSVTSDFVATSTAGGFAAIDSWSRLFPSGCRELACSQFVDGDHIVASRPSERLEPSTLAQGETFTVSHTFTPPNGFPRGTAIVRAKLVAYASGAQILGNTGEVSGAARLDQFVVVARP